MMNEMKNNELNKVNGGAKAASGKSMLVCCSCGYKLDPATVQISIMPGEMTQCPRCRQVTMTLQKIWLQA